MPTPLVPSISSNQLTVSALLKSPAALNAVLAQLTADRLVMPAFFGTSVSTIQGGGLVYSVLLNGSNFTISDVAERSPGAEYVVTDGETTFDLATPQDWGSKVQILDEERDRSHTITLGNKLIQQANTLTKKIDQIAIAAIDAALTRHSIAGVPGNYWDGLVTAGPEAELTPSTKRPTADFARANLLARVDDLGIGTLNVLVCHPQQEAALKIGYGEGLAAALASAGITSVRTSTLVTNGTAYLVEEGKAGQVAFERPLMTETIDDRHHRSTWIQSYAVPAFAVTTPGAVRKITGLNVDPEA
ncbi:major capsid protein [Rhodococcus sp. NPDC003318]|uniref:major capsid protein n=1 Tax=Rhodococcus sp. NPDC003318 TaxID=3364503 RepID=UPI00367BB002